MLFCMEDHIRYSLVNQPLLVWLDSPSAHGRRAWLHVTFCAGSDFRDPPLAQRAKWPADGWGGTRLHKVMLPVTPADSERLKKWTRPCVCFSFLASWRAPNASLVEHPVAPVPTCRRILQGTAQIRRRALFPTRCRACQRTGSTPRECHMRVSSRNL